MRTAIRQLIAEANKRSKSLGRNQMSKTKIVKVFKNGELIAETAKRNGESRIEAADRAMSEFGCDVYSLDQLKIEES